MPKTIKVPARDTESARKSRTLDMLQDIVQNQLERLAKSSASGLFDPKTAQTLTSVVSAFTKLEAFTAREEGKLDYSELGTDDLKALDSE